jgi:hypothetical protein
VKSIRSINRSEESKFESYKISDGNTAGAKLFVFISSLTIFTLPFLGSPAYEKAGWLVYHTGLKITPLITI